MADKQERISYLESTEKGIQLYFHQTPFFIKGATSFSNVTSLKEFGGNCLRIWDTDSTMSDLDEAQDNQIAVLLVLNILSERQGMDYTNREWILQQRERIASDVKKYRDHPALMMWSLGNELDLDYQDMSVWQELDTLSRLVRSIDPRRLITTSIMPRRNTILYLKKYCPELDIIGINSFGFAPDVEHLMGGPRGWNKAYFLSEWGPKGYWEVYQTDWEAAYEATSSEKIAFMNQVYQKHIETQVAQCMGSFVFFWGYKQERTHTWFSFFDEEGAPSDLAHTMKALWSGEDRRDPTFEISSITLNGISGDHSIYVQPGEPISADLRVVHQHLSPITGTWEIRKEGHYRGINGGDQEPDTSPITDLIKVADDESCQFSAPVEEGAYRLFYTVRDSSGSFGTANKCFFVMQTDS